MNQIPRPDQAAAVRRASAFLLHNGNRDLDGVNAVLDEVAGNELATLHLLLGLGTVFESLLPVIYSDAGQWLVRQTIADLAEIEDGAPK